VGVLQRATLRTTVRERDDLCCLLDEVVLFLLVLTRKPTNVLNHEHWRHRPNHQPWHWWFCACESRESRSARAFANIAHVSGRRACEMIA
jgi:acyl-CoA thioesterase